MNALEVLVVDDNPADLHLIRRYLERVESLHLSVRTCQDAESVPLLLQQQPSDLVFMDYFVGAKTGAELVENLTQQFRQTCFVLLTGLGDESVVTASMRAGASDYLNKQHLSVDVLESLLHRVLERQRQRYTYSALLASLSDAVLVLSQDGVIAEANQAALDLCQSNYESLIGESVKNLMPLAMAARQIELLSQKSSGSERFEWQFLVAGEIKTLEVLSCHARILGQPLSWIVLRDISQKKRVEQQRAIQSAIIDSIQDFVFYANPDGRLRYINETGQKLLGIKEEHVPYLSLVELFSDDVSSYLQQNVLPELTRGNKWSGELPLLSAVGKTVPVSIAATPVFHSETGEVDVLAAVMRDNSHDYEVQAELKFQAEHDVLTGLPNRTYFYSYLKAALAKSKNREQSLAVLFVDLDHFKGINDTLGHDQGDELLKMASRRLQSYCRSDDLCVRLGGDEFVIVLEHVQTYKEVEVMASRLLKAMGREYILQGQAFFVPPSIGIAMYPEAGYSVEELLQHADVAMYQAKHQGRNRFCFFTNEVQQQVNRYEYLRNALQISLNNLMGFSLVYQPVVSKDGNWIGAEALLRWTYAEENISPAEFIPVAEHAGLIGALGDWVLATALAQLNHWRAAYGFSGYIAVNISVLQLRDVQYSERILGLMRHAQLEPKWLRLEVTETTLLDEVAAGLSIFKQLDALNLPLAIDDFGSGYASFQHLRLLNIHTLKIDRSFLEKIPSDSKECSMVEAILALAEQLGIQVVIEGVETEAQHQWLARFPTVSRQGYYYSRPLTVADFEQRL
ncbi:two-component system response regulator [Balneatrix alpica]|uniref:two-component system response regulator n=1 Tax=Balneatrix alpica TaxID=75684 RepID=UPI002738D7BE|nr:EAL domain-containing protein [Balneatrix alpica]